MPLQRLGLGHDRLGVQGYGTGYGQGYDSAQGGGGSGAGGGGGSSYMQACSLLLGTGLDSSASHATPLDWCLPRTICPAQLHTAAQQAWPSLLACAQGYGRSSGGAASSAAYESGYGSQSYGRSGYSAPSDYASGAGQKRSSAGGGGSQDYYGQARALLPGAGPRLCAAGRRASATWRLRGH